jgi:NitT/TauT family transport system substrate-binding protein
VTQLNFLNDRSRQMVSWKTHSFALALGASLGLASFQTSMAADLRLWRHGMTEAKSNAGFVGMVAEPGFADRFGLRVELTQFKNDSLALRALIAGDLDSYEGGPALVAASKGAAVKVVGCSWIGISIGLFARPGIATIQQAAKGTFAASAPGALPELLTRAMFQHHKLDPSLATFVGYGSDAERYKGVVAGVVDVAALDMEHESSAHHDKLNLISAFEDEFPGFARFCIHVSDRSLGTRRADLINFLRAETSALSAAKASKEREVALARKMTSAKDSDARAALVFDQALKRNNVRPDLSVPVDRLQEWQDILMRSGAIDKALDLTKFVDTDALSAAKAAPTEVFAAK